MEISLNSQENTCATVPEPLFWRNFEWRVSFFNSLRTVPMAISYHQFRFLIGYYSVTQIWYFIQKKTKKNKKEMKLKNDNNTNILMKNNNNKQQQKMPGKIHVNLELHSSAWTRPTEPWRNRLQCLETWKRYRW